MLKTHFYQMKIRYGSAQHCCVNSPLCCVHYSTAFATSQFLFHSSCARSIFWYILVNVRLNFNCAVWAMFTLSNWLKSVPKLSTNVENVNIFAGENDVEMVYEQGLRDALRCGRWDVDVEMRTLKWGRWDEDVEMRKLRWGRWDLRDIEMGTLRWGRWDGDV